MEQRLFNIGGRRWRHARLLARNHAKGLSGERPGCRYADFFRQLGEPELGALLLCESDIHVTELIGSPEVKLERTQTIMQGAKYHDFRWSMKRGDERQQ